MRKRPLALAAALVLVATLQPAAAAQARNHVKKKPNPCAPAALSATQQHIITAIKNRSAALTHLATTLDGWTHVDADHRGILDQLITTDAAALSQLQLSVADATVCRLVKLDAVQVVADYRVYSLVLPQTYLTIAADTGAYGASQLVAAEPELRSLVQAAKDTQPVAEQLWTELVQQAAAAQNTLTPVGDAVLSLSPGAYYPDTAAALAKQSRAVAAGSRSLAAAISAAEQLQALPAP